MATDPMVEACTELLRFFVNKGIAFNAVEDAHLKKFIQLIAPSYAQQIPNRANLNSILDQESARACQDDLELIAHARVVSLVADGWSNRRSESLIHFILMLPDQAIFLHAEEMGTRRKTAANIAGILGSIIREIGADKFASVVTDNEPVMIAAHRILQSSFGHINCIGCLCHQLNLIVKDLSKVPLVKSFLEKTNEIATYDRGRHVESYYLRSLGSNAIKLPVPTRWGSVSARLKSLLDAQIPMKTAAVTLQPFDAETAKTVMDASFWSTVDCLWKLIHPIEEAITHFESDEPRLHQQLKKLSDWTSSINNALKHAWFTAAAKRDILDVLKTRNGIITNPTTFLSAMLYPTSFDQMDQISVKKAMDSFQSQAKRLHVDSEAALKQLAQYKSRAQLFGRHWKLAATMNPLHWWQGFLRRSFLNWNKWLSPF